ncbi:unnamed protein product [Vitrella brassicaformis CCMP3155]|uniref:cyclic pyranopterin monophosphate synthase n=2 Tax=Vitrella brassicaformis TaxID=1169539 RepID=A0A0G4FSU4_VITBC|nr:unnamed protein product [Vitrella brassicaformis CCMP3155]|mmetsp:Transcript_41118/g.116989  ORF Transcript_41118/g.116989 Transcript_41118/m.116989 type:complete len:202 (+) Transcript_41118:11-616(+)|eukprot:CEM17521.1 unnamed protein product [Vitrella brassicaformis CCMP3155]
MNVKAAIRRLPGLSRCGTFAVWQNASTSRAADAHTPSGSSSLTHVASDDGKAQMVDVSGKVPTRRTAIAGSRVLLGQEVFRLVQENLIKKGDVLTTAKLAGIMGSKRTADLIPLCHPLSLSHVDVSLTLDANDHAVDIRAEATTVHTTGVEMEALTAASVAALTVYDMCKSASKALVITHVRLLEKTGGKSGHFIAGREPG